MTPASSLSSSSSSALPNNQPHPAATMSNFSKLRAMVVAMPEPDLDGLRQQLNKHSDALTVFSRERKEYGATVLHVAAACGRLAVVRLLMSHGAAPTLKDGRGQTALLVACRYKHLAVVQYMLGLDDHASPTEGAAKNKARDAINMPDSEGDPPLFWAIRCGSLQLLDVLLTTPGINCSKRNLRKECALHIAAILVHPQQQQQQQQQAPHAHGQQLTRSVSSSSALRSSTTRVSAANLVPNAPTAAAPPSPVTAAAAAAAAPVAVVAVTGNVFGVAATSISATLMSRLLDAAGTTAFRSLDIEDYKGRTPLEIAAGSLAQTGVPSLSLALVR